MNRGFMIGCLLAATAGQADPLHEVADGTFQHEDSGWIFPQQLAGCTRVGTPQTPDGSTDASAYYARSVEGVRTVAVVSVHVTGSPEATSVRERQAQTEARASFEVGKLRRLAGTRRLEEGARTVLYVVDTGPWVVTIQGAATEQPAELDAFARAQPWESLPLTDATCTGPACR